MPNPMKNGPSLKTNGVAISVAGFCNLCGKKSECKCDRCGDFYCSELCQQKDWGRHRFICFPMPKLVKVVECSPNKSVVRKDTQRQPIAEETKSLENTIPLPNGSCVILTGFKSSNRVYIRSTNPSVTSEYTKVLKDVNEFGETSSGLPEKPKNISSALALKDGKWCRVHILGGGNNKAYSVLFVDFGHFSKRNIKELRKTDDSIDNLPCFTHMVQLKGIDFSMNQKLLKALTQYTNQEYKVVFENTDKSSGEVELYKWGSTILLNSIIEDLISKHNDNGKDADLLSVVSSSSNIDLKKNERSDKGPTKKPPTQQINNNISNNKAVCSPTEKSANANTSSAENSAPMTVGSNLSENKTKATVMPRQIQKPCFNPPFETIPLNEKDKNCRVFIMDNSYIESGFIGCLSDKQFDNLKLVSTYLKEQDVGDQPYKPKADEYCLANFENEWFRAKVVEVLSEDKFLVVYIDFTNENELSSSSIRRYPMSLNYPCCTTLCAIEGLPEVVTENLKKFLESECPPYSFLDIDSVRLDGGYTYIKSNELLKKMRDSKLIEF